MERCRNENPICLGLLTSFERFILDSFWAVKKVMPCTDSNDEIIDPTILPNLIKMDDESISDAYRIEEMLVHLRYLSNKNCAIN